MMFARTTIMLATAVLLTLSMSAHAAGPQLINYQGILTNELGQPLDGPIDLTFRIYHVQSGGAALWTETHSAVPVDRGVFNVVLGSATLLPRSVFYATSFRWLGITVGSDPELAPRQRFTSVPWAMHATMADTATICLSCGGSGAGWTISGDNMYAAVPGNVGIGRTAPAKKLHIGSHTVPDSEGMIRLSSRSGTQGSNRTWDIGVPETDADTSGPGYSFIINDTNNDTEADFMIKYGTGNVGIGTVTPAARLDVVRPTTSNDPVARWNTLTTVGMLTRSTIMTLSGGSFDVTDPLATPSLRLNHTATGNVLLAGGGGNVGIGTSSPAAKLEVVGTVRVSVLEIAGADLAEKFPMSEQSEPGTVVVIDPDRPGSLRPSQRGYDSRVAGVISGAGGLSVGAVLGLCTPEPDAQPIALSGRVWVKCDATEHAIEPGDLLTTSGRPGHAMKAADPSRAHGAVLGKAMSRLARGETGLVLVLINLQ